VNFHPRRGEEPDLNMTSLIDVVLLLLIFFMLSTASSTGAAAMRLPGRAEPGRRVRDGEISHAGGGYRVNGRPLNSPSPTRCRAPRRGRDHGPVTIRADARARIRAW
jgi:biopolymer transport protein ExbD